MTDHANHCVSKPHQLSPKCAKLLKCTKPSGFLVWEKPKNIRIYQKAKLVRVLRLLVFDRNSQGHNNSDTLNSFVFTSTNESKFELHYPCRRHNGKQFVCVNKNTSFTCQNRQNNSWSGFLGYEHHYTKECSNKKLYQGNGACNWFLVGESGNNDLGWYRYYYRWSGIAYLLLK